MMRTRTNTAKPAAASAAGRLRALPRVGGAGRTRARRPASPGNARWRSRRRAVLEVAREAKAGVAATRVHLDGAGAVVEPGPPVQQQRPKLVVGARRAVEDDCPRFRKVASVKQDEVRQKLGEGLAEA